ncbi:MAG TPA: hypothetical protein VLW53_22430, partial [Candidatus Eisenbacteria bacterium]|nr:hypothetical protein [Candidatus Eisenbacteria bacterium]
MSHMRTRVLDGPRSVASVVPALANRGGAAHRRPARRLEHRSSASVANLTFRSDPSHRPDHVLTSGAALRSDLANLPDQAILADLSSLQHRAGNRAVSELVEERLAVQRARPADRPHPATGSPVQLGTAPLGATERDLLRRWIGSWQVELPGLAARPLPGGRAANIMALAEALQQSRREQSGRAGGTSTSESAPELAALMDSVGAVYDDAIPPACDRLRPDEIAVVERALNEGTTCGEPLTGREDHDLDVLARRVLGDRLGVRLAAVSRVGPEDLATDVRYLALKTGPLRAAYGARTVRLRGTLPAGDVIRGERGEKREEAMRRIAWLYRRYGIRDWSAWYKANIVRHVTFLGANLIYGAHKDVAAALHETEAELGYPGRYPAWPQSAIGGGYNVRGWGGALGSHDYGMAIDLYPKTNIEILGGHGWSGTPAGRDRLAVVTLLTPDYFSLAEFARQPRARRVATADTAAAAHAAIGRALQAEIDLVDTIDGDRDEKRWVGHLDDLL